MRTSTERRRSWWCVLLLAAAAACGAEPPEDETEMEGGAGAEDAASSAAPGEQSFTLRPSDVDGWIRGTRARIQHVRDMQRRIAGAESGRDTLAAMIDVMSIDSVGAAAAGMSEDRFTQVEYAIQGVLAARQGREMTEAIYRDMDTTALPEEMRERIRSDRAEMERAYSDPYADLPEDAAAEIRRREDELARLQADYLAALMGSHPDGR